VPPSSPVVVEPVPPTTAVPPVAEVPPEPAPPPPTFPPYLPNEDDVETVKVPLDQVEALDYYYSKLTLTDLGYPGAITRASHWGDSVIGGDGMTEAIRRRLQQRFGDAGHGFHAMGRYSRWYGHRGVRYDERRDWDTCLIIFKCRPDQRYGYAGVTSSSRGKALSTWQTTTDDFGQAVSRFELWYQKRPDGGGFEVRVDGAVKQVVDARSPVVRDEVETLRVPDGRHEFDVAALGEGVAQAYGVVLERDGPGVVWDELSLIGSFTQRLDYQNAEHLAGQVRRRDVDLMVFILGGNDLSREHSDLKLTTQPYEAEYSRVIRKFRAGKPQASCLIMSLTDHAKRVNGAIISRAVVPRLVAAQREVAHKEGCAFFDTFASTGGDGTIERWRNVKPPLASPDLRHPTVAGQRHIGSLLYHALMKGYAEYRQRQTGKPLPPLPAPPLEVPLAGPAPDPSASAARTAL
jgi:lysophospholipase L1-like esterase